MPSKLTHCAQSWEEDAHYLEYKCVKMEKPCKKHVKKKELSFQALQRAQKERIKVVSSQVTRQEKLTSDLKSAEALLLSVRGACDSTISEHNRSTKKYSKILKRKSRRQLQD
jgi:hypothetical protein